jgi:hypothetical protein
MVQDQRMVIVDRGMNLEIVPALRAIPEFQTGGGNRINYNVTPSNAGDPIDLGHLGVATNHALQARCFFTGEISFSAKQGLKESELEASLYPGLKLLVDPNVYVVTASTPAEFVALYQRLISRSDLERVEPYMLHCSAQP